MSGEYDPKAKRFAEVNGRRMAYAEAGDGPPVVFLHGNPTSSFLWRAVIPHVLPDHRAIAPDLIGMGDSDKLDPSGPDRYRFVEHREFLDGLLAQLLDPAEPAVFVVHDWGSALGFHYAHRFPERVRAISFMEAIVAPLVWDDWPPPVRPVFEGFRSPAGEKMVLEDNMFVEQVLPGAILRRLTDEEMAEYRRPFADAGEARRPTLTWPREIPIEGAPADVDAIVADYSAFLARSKIPKLFVAARPGAILRERLADLVRTWPNLSEVEVAGVHFVQEDSGEAIGAALESWLETLRAR